MTVTDQAFAQLQQQVADLQQQLAGQQLDTLQPNYLTVNPDGTISADFTGKINALGLTLPGDGALTGDAPDNLIQWIRSSDSATVANLYGAIDLPGTPEAGQTYARIEAGAPDNLSEWAILQLYGNHPPPFTGQNRINCEVGGQEVTLIDDTGASSFLQLLTTGTVKLQFGTGLSANIAAGEATITVALPRAWTNHLLFIGTASPASNVSAGNYTQGSGISDAGHGGIQIVTNVAQQWRYQWLSLGN